MSIIIKSSQLHAGIVNKSEIKSGSTVLVRISSEKQDGKYEGYVAGAKVTLHSKNPLKSGSSFLAEITSKDGKIYVTPKNNEFNTNNLQKQSLELEQLKDDGLLKMMHSLGIPSDDISLEILKNMHQMEIKYDKKIINSVRNLVQKFKGKEKKAAQLILLLMQKDISISESQINDLLELLETKDFDKDKADFELINKINSKKGRWFILPFNFINLSSDQIEGSGFIRILLVDDNLKQINLDCDYKDVRYLFNIKFDFGKCTDIYYNLICNNQEKRESIIKEIKNRFLNKVNIEEKSVENLEDNGSHNEIIVSVGGTV